MDSAKSDLEIIESSLSKERVTVTESNSIVIGFYEFSDEDGPAMTSLFVEPAWIGKGIGQKLWLHAIKKAKELSW